MCVPPATSRWDWVSERAPVTRVRGLTLRCAWRCCVHGALLALLPVTQALAADQPGRVPRPVIEAGAGDGATCVADTAFMRTNHMDLLKHQRDDTVHRGIRTPKFSLKGCVNCHASKKTNSVIAGADDFCSSCHRYVGVTLDCFECHNATAQATPGKTSAVSSAVLPASAATGGKQ